MRRKKKSAKLLTKHGVIRFDTRVINIADSDSEIRRVRKNGKDITWYDGEFRRYLDFKKNKKNELLICDEKLYIFDFYSKKLITVFDIPEK